MSPFAAILVRDLTVARRNTRVVLMAALPQPVLVSLVFADLMPRLGLIPRTFGVALVPGLVAIAMLVAGVQGVLSPLAADLAGSREVNERLLAPLSVRAVALEKIVAGALQASLVGLIALPLLMLITRETTRGLLSPSWTVLPLLAAGGVISAAFGLILGSSTEPRHSGLLFAAVAGPMMLFGCAYYPFAALTVLGPLRYLFLLNPLVFICEAMRFGMTPALPHMPLVLLLAGLGIFALLFTAAGAAQFARRTLG